MNRKLEDEAGAGAGAGALKTSPYVNRITRKFYANRLYMILKYTPYTRYNIIGPKCIELQRLDPINIRRVRTAARLL